jgi:hypothetical protein
MLLHETVTAGKDWLEPPQLQPQLAWLHHFHSHISGMSMMKVLRPARLRMVLSSQLCQAQ